MANLEKLKALIEPVVVDHGFELVRVALIEGPSLTLQIMLEDPATGQMKVDDCARVSRKISLLLDETDPIESEYMLEVSSPGIERALTRDWHFEALMGQQLLVRLIRPVEGVRDFIGTLTDYRDGTLTLLLDEKTEMNVERGETAFIRLYNDFSGGVSK